MRTVLRLRIARRCGTLPKLWPAALNCELRYPLMNHWVNIGMMENQMEKKMENDMETGVAETLLGALENTLCKVHSGIAADKAFWDHDKKL